ncbi:40S ribosomal protein S21, partial [Klebsiella pneumoniae]|nr:40S ribosomal protein S21 [Klebsiella pneumoniae]
VPCGRVGFSCFIDILTTFRRVLTVKLLKNFPLQTYKMQNDAGEFVDLYCPRKCSASNRLIHAKDHASVQLVIADVDPATGRAADTSKMYVVCGAIRRMGESDDCIVRLTKKDGILAKNY